MWQAQQMDSENNAAIERIMADAPTFAELQRRADEAMRYGNAQAWWKALAESFLQEANMLFKMGWRGEALEQATQAVTWARMSGDAEVLAETQAALDELKGDYAVVFGALPEGVFA